MIGAAMITPAAASRAWSAVYWPLKIASPSGAVRQSPPGLITSGIRNSFHVHMNMSTITVAIDILSIARVIERIGDHAKNIAECVIYIVKGLDVRHTPLQAIESQLG